MHNNDSDPPEEELEMATEEITGKPFSGKPDERVVALEKRVNYLEGLLSGYSVRSDPQESWSVFDRDAHRTIQKDLAEARKQLVAWKTQHEGRN